MHNAWDYAFSGGAALTLQNGAQFTNNSRGSYGDNTVFMTPDGTAYRIIHGTFEPGAGEQGTATPMPDMSSAISQAGNVDAASAQLEGLQEQLRVFQEQRDKLSGADFLIRQAEFTEVFKDQTEQIKNSTEAMQLRTGLELEGVRPEVIDGELKKLEVSRLLNNNVQALDKALENKNITQEQYNQLLAESKRLAGENVAAIEAETAALTQANDALKVKQQVEQLASNISSEITGALGDVIKGTKSVEDAFSDMLENIGNMFIDMAMQMLQSAITKQLVNLFTGLLGGGGGLFGGGMPIPGFSQGGQILPNKVALVGENGPELITTGNQPSMVTNAGRTQDLLTQYSPANAPAKQGAGQEKQSEGMSGYNVPINITTGPVMQFEGNDYISRADFEVGMAKATQEGARQGEIRTLQRMRMNPATRRKVGL